MGLFNPTLVFLLLWLHQTHSTENQTAGHESDEEGLSFGRAWCYGDDPKCGEKKWRKTSSHAILCDTGKLQSPIDFPPEESLPTTGEPIAIERNDYVLRGFTLENPGNTLEIYPKIGDKRRYIHSGPQKAKYWFHSINIHWGADDAKGSEHTVEGKAFAAEIHLLFVNDNYKNLTLALHDFKTPNAVAAIGILVNEVPESPLLDSLLDHLPKVKLPSVEQVQVEADLDLTGLLEGEKAYNYLGSLAIPPCFEDVEFIIMMEPVDLSKKLLDSLRDLNNHEGGKIVNNFRRARPVDGHQVRIVPLSS